MTISVINGKPHSELQPLSLKSATISHSLQHRVTTLQTEKNPRLFQMKVQAICQTNTRLLIQILRGHYV